MGKATVEVALHDEDIEPFLEIMDSGTVRIHGCVDSDLPRFLDSQMVLNDLQKSNFLRLWNAPDDERQFSRGPGFVLITLVTGLR
jgi:hypothetical protein